MALRIEEIKIKIIPDEMSDDPELEYPVGVVAEAQVSYPTNMGGRRLEILSSDGLWGIDGYDDDYIREVAQEEVLDLKDHLKEFGVSMSGFEEAAERAINKL